MGKRICILVGRTARNEKAKKVRYLNMLWIYDRSLTELTVGITSLTLEYINSNAMFQEQICWSRPLLQDQGGLAPAVKLLAIGSLIIVWIESQHCSRPSPGLLMTAPRWVWLGGSQAYWEYTAAVGSGSTPVPSASAGCFPQLCFQLIGQRGQKRLDIIICWICYHARRYSLTIFPVWFQTLVTQCWDFLRPR